jgi:exportin-1
VYVRQFVSTLLLKAFPNLTPAQVDAFVLGLFKTQSNINDFKTHLRDFLVQIKEFGTSDELFLEEQRASEAARQAEESAHVAEVPGLAYHGGPVRVTQIDDDDITQ